MPSRLVVGAIIENDGKFLLGKRKDNIGPYPNTWLILGGGVNLDKETIEEGIRREIKEEAGIEITNIEKVWFDEDYEPDKNGVPTHYVYLVFKAKYKSGKIKAGDDIAQLQWFDKKDFKRLPLPRPTIKVFKYLNWL